MRLRRATTRKETTVHTANDFLPATALPRVVPPRTLAPAYAYATTRDLDGAAIEALGFAWLEATAWVTDAGTRVRLDRAADLTDTEMLPTEIEAWLAAHPDGAARIHDLLLAAIEPVGA